MRRGECCALKWEDITHAERSIHVCRNAVKTTGDEIIVKAPKTKAGNRYVYFSAEMESLLREYEAFCAAETERYDRREQTKDDYVFRRKGMKLPMTPSTFTWRFKKILKANDLPTDLNVHSLRHTAASLFIASGTDVGTVAGSGDDHLVDGVRALHVERIGSGDLLGRCCHGREAQCQGQIYAFAHCVYIDMFSAGRQRRMLSAAK